MTRAGQSGRRRPANSIFRREAIEHHRRSDDAVNLPHYATLPVRLTLWGLIVLVLLAAAAALAAEVPRYATGRAVVVDTASSTIVAVQLEPGERSQVREGQPVTVTFDESPVPVSTRVFAVLPRGQGVDLSAGPPGSLPDLSEPPVIVVATVPKPGGVVPSRGVGRASVETGQQPLLSWVVP